MKTNTAGTDSLSRCIEVCSACHDTCQKMIYQHCLKIGGPHVEPEHLKLMADCVQICRVSADFMLRGSHRHKFTCQICANICKACADDCERIGDMDECVKTCRECAEVCSEMAA